MISAQPEGKSRKTFPKEVFLNGEWYPHDKAVVSVFDRGFLFGDGIYEVIPFYNGKTFGLQKHLDRLIYCLCEIELDFEVETLRDVISEAIDRAGLSEKDGAIYIQVTRGMAPRTHFFPEDVQTTVLLYAYPVQLEGFEKKQISVLVSKDLRWHRCDIKSISLLANVKSNNKAYVLGYDENILVRRGFFTEGSHSSIFFVKQGILYTHPEGRHILRGITRNILIEMCKDLKLDVVEEALNVDQISEVDEVFITGTTTQILSVKKMVLKENVIFEKPEKGEITALLQNAFLGLTRSRI